MRAPVLRPSCPRLIPMHIDARPRERSQTTGHRIEHTRRSIPLLLASVGRRGTRCLHYAPVRRAWSWLRFSCDLVCRSFPPAASALVGGHRGTLFCPRLAEMPRRHPALDANSRLEFQIVQSVSMALPCGYRSHRGITARSATRTHDPAQTCGRTLAG
jgi:hypothetical protein